MKHLALILLLLPATLPAQNLIEGHQFTDIRNNQILKMPVVDADQVEGYEILYATPGTGDIAEIAGHLLLRIHLRDVPEDQDLVLSFLADTGPLPTLGNQEPILYDCRKRKNWLNLLQTPHSADASPWASISQSLRGLAGGFPVTMDVQTMAYTLKSYAVEQDRNLLRYRLILSHEQRDALTHYLIDFQQHPTFKYYFFHQNCGSVLVRVVGEGTGENQISNFRPWVSPPHSLCALLIREGLAEQVTPNFHSTRAQGDLYREWFRIEYPLWVAQFPDLPWPKLKDFLSPKVDTRVLTLQQLEAVVLSDPNQVGLLLAVGPLLQQMELSTDVRSGMCRDLTSKATTEARNLQARLMQRFPDQEPEKLFEKDHPLAPPPPRFEGSLHTGLLALETGPVWLDDQAGWMVSGILLKQEMGSRSALAMQRAGALTLGHLSLTFDDESLQEAQVTVLSFKKFRERLGRVPSGLLSTQGWGMGLKVLDIEKQSIGPDLQGSLAGVSGWINLLSSTSHRDYLMIGAGIDVGWSHDQVTNTDWGFTFPLQADSLLSIGVLEWRSTFAWSPNSIHDAPIEMEFTNDLSVPVGEWGATEINLHCSTDLRWSDDEQRSLSKLYLEFRRW